MKHPRVVRVHLKCEVNRAQLTSGTSTDATFTLNIPESFRKCRILVENAWINNAGNLVAGVPPRVNVHTSSFQTDSNYEISNGTNVFTRSNILTSLEAMDSKYADTYYNGANPQDLPVNKFQTVFTPETAFVANNVNLEGLSLNIQLRNSNGDLFDPANTITTWYMSLIFMDISDEAEFFNPQAGRDGAKPFPYV